MGITGLGFHYLSKIVCRDGRIAVTNHSTLCHLKEGRGSQDCVVRDLIDLIVTVTSILHLVVLF